MGMDLFLRDEEHGGNSGEIQAMFLFGFHYLWICLVVFIFTPVFIVYFLFSLYPVERAWILKFLKGIFQRRSKPFLYKNVLRPVVIMMRAVRIAGILI